MSIETSIIIRTKNEEKWIKIVLEKLFQQTYKNFEIIIIDSGSIDRTIEIAKKFPVRIFKIPFENFSFPYALNYGIKKSKAEKFIVIMSAHSVPISENWLENGLNNFKKYKKIMGVYGFLKPSIESSFWDKFFMNGFNFLIKLKNKQKQFIINKAGMGVMGFTNAIVRKDLWEKHNFNESYGLGGEDGEWANYWFKRGYKAIRDWNFTVYHSHKLGLWGWFKQWQYWESSGEPHSFHKPSYRKDDIYLK